jgi:hypothetical protein
MKNHYKRKILLFLFIFYLLDFINANTFMCENLDIFQINDNEIQNLNSDPDFGHLKLDEKINFLKISKCYDNIYNNEFSLDVYNPDQTLKQINFDSFDTRVDKTISPKKEFYRDVLFWFETFSKPLRDHTDEENREIGLASFKVLLQTFLVSAISGISWSSKIQESLLHFQKDQSDKKVYENFDWAFPLASLLSHGGRVNFLFKNKRLNNFSDYVCNKFGYLEEEEFKCADHMRLMKRRFSSHGFKVEDNKILESKGFGVSLKNLAVDYLEKVEKSIYSSSKTNKFLYMYYRKIKEGENENQFSKDEYNHFPLQNWFYAPFGGLKNKFNNEEMKKFNSKAKKFSGHFFFRLGWDVLQDKNPPQRDVSNTWDCFMIGVESSPAGEKDFYGRDHGVMSAIKNSNNDISLTGTHKWAKIFEGKKFPHKYGGITVYINETLKLIPIYEITKILVNILQDEIAINSNFPAGNPKTEDETLHLTEEEIRENVTKETKKNQRLKDVRKLIFLLLISETKHNRDAAVNGLLRMAYNHLDNVTEEENNNFRNFMQANKPTILKRNYTTPNTIDRQYILI